MKLAEKTFVYSILLGSIMVAILIGYFTWMLPSLYLDYVKRDNLELAMKMHEQYIEERSYDKLIVKNPTITCTIEMPYEQDEIMVVSKFFTAHVLLVDEEIKGIVKELKDFIAMKGEFDEIDWEGNRFQDIQNALSDKLLNKKFLSPDFPLKVNIDTKNENVVFQNEEYRVHAISDKLVVFEFHICDENN